MFFVLFVDCSVGGGHAADALVSVGEPVQRHLSDAVVVNESSRNNQKMENLEKKHFCLFILNQFNTTLNTILNRFLKRIKIIS